MPSPSTHDEDDSCSDGEAHETSRPSGTVLKVVKRVTHYRELFLLPPDEQFADNYHCALRSGILLQGRVYIFEHHICFYANIFGLVTSHTIQISDVLGLKKASNAFCPNSIEIQTKSRKFFFTSFLSRDEAYNLMEVSWNNYKKHRNSANLDAYDTLGHSSQLDDDASVPRNTSLFGGEVEEGGPSWPILTTPAPECPTSGKNAWTLMLSLPLPTASVEAVAQLCQSPEDFLQQWHDQMEDTSVVYGDWILKAGVGKMRDASFTSKVRGAGPLAPATAECFQAHRASMHGQGDALEFVYEVQQSMPNLPFGEYFTVQACWIVSSTVRAYTQRGALVRIYVRVNFVKSTMLAGQIQSGTLKQSRTSYALVATMLKQRLSASGIADAEALENPVDAALKAAARRVPAGWRHHLDPTGGFRYASPFLDTLSLSSCRSCIVAVLIALAVVVLSFSLEGMGPPVPGALRDWDPGVLHIKRDAAQSRRLKELAADMTALRGDMESLLTAPTWLRSDNAAAAAAAALDTSLINSGLHTMSHREEGPCEASCCPDVRGEGSSLGGRLSHDAATSPPPQRMAEGGARRSTGADAAESEQLHGEVAALGALLQSLQRRMQVLTER